MWGQGKNKNSGGFTIIETMMFVAISGLLLVAILGGITATMQRQRYTDGVRNAQGYFEQQYNETSSVINTRTGVETCDASGVRSDAQSNVGGSDCVILGKALRFTDGDDTITSYTVVGRDLPLAQLAALADDNAVFRALQPRIVTSVGSAEYDVPWSITVARAVEQLTPADRAFNTLLILRSPRSGSISTYNIDIASYAPANVVIDDGTANKLVTANRNRSLTICLRSPDFPSERAGLQLSGAGGDDAVEAVFAINSATECMGA